MATRPSAQIDSTGHKNLHWLFVLRNLMVCGEGILILITVYGLDIPISQRPLWFVLGTITLINLLTRLRLALPAPVSDLEFFFQLVLDVLGITAALYFTGGATNPIVWFFLLPLIITATVLPHMYTWYMVVLTTSCYTVLIGYYVPLPDIEAQTPDHAMAMTPHVMALTTQHYFDLHMFGMWFGFVFSAGLVAYFIMEMANTLREHERRLAQAREQSLRDERVIALGTLAAGAAHEMGTPLGTMAILIHEMEREYGPEKFDDLNAKMHILREQVDRCKKALSVMSASAGEMRAESGHIMALESYLEDIIEQWRQQRPGVKLHYHVDGMRPAPNIVAERTLSHALINIMNNSADVSPDLVELWAQWNSSRAILEIRDQGPGINPIVAAAAGKAPISTKEQGMGVGLFLAYSTIDRLGGHIELINRNGNGACIRIELPLLPSTLTYETTPNA